MKPEDVLADLRLVILDDQTALSDGAQQMADAIIRRHGSGVRALVFYGSAMRQEGSDDKMYDFYVISDSYKSVYGNNIRRLVSFLLPPGVHYLEIRATDGRRLRSKYSVISEKAFHRRVRGGAFESMLWARFAQPAIVLSRDAALRCELVDTLALAVFRLAAEVRPLVREGCGPLEPWIRGLSESYRTELRPERHDARAAEIIARFSPRYERLSRILFPGTTASPAAAIRLGRMRCRLRWFLRRIIGKPAGALRILKAAATFDAGLDYILEKIASHSGVKLEVSDAERRRPVLHAPILAWRLYRAGAFR